MGFLLEYWWILASFFTLFFVMRRIGGERGVNYKDQIEKGAIILDVRTHSEFSSGHIENSVNMPLDKLEGTFEELDVNKPVITVCAMGGRAEKAKKILISKGFKVHNGGGWKNLEKKIK